MGKPTQCSRGSSGPGHGFQGPPGNFIEGVADPTNRYNWGAHRTFRGGRGGGQRPPPSWPPPPPLATAAVAHAEPTATVQTAAPALPEVAVDTVRALAAVSIPVTSTGVVKVGDGASEKVPDKCDGEKLSKWAIKKKKLPCYRCGEPGHFVAECTTELCDYCCRSQHVTSDCPLLSGPKPVVNIYGVCC